MSKVREFKIEQEEVNELREAALAKTAFMELISNMTNPNEYVEKKYIDSVTRFNELGEKLIIKYTGSSDNVFKVTNWSCDYATLTFKVEM